MNTVPPAASWGPAPPPPSRPPPSLLLRMSAPILAVPSASSYSYSSSSSLSSSPHSPSTSPPSPTSISPRSPRVPPSMPAPSPTPTPTPTPASMPCPSRPPPQHPTGGANPTPPGGAAASVSAPTQTCSSNYGTASATASSATTSGSYSSLMTPPTITLRTSPPSPTAPRHNANTLRSFDCGLMMMPPPPSTPAPSPSQSDIGDSGQIQMQTPSSPAPTPPLMPLVPAASNSGSNSGPGVESVLSAQSLCVPIPPSSTGSVEAHENVGGLSTSPRMENHRECTLRPPSPAPITPLPTPPATPPPNTPTTPAPPATPAPPMSLSPSPPNSAPHPRPSSAWTPSTTPLSPSPPSTPAPENPLTPSPPSTSHNSHATRVANFDSALFDTSASSCVISCAISGTQQPEPQQPPILPSNPSPTAAQPPPLRGPTGRPQFNKNFKSMSTADLRINRHPNLPSHTASVVPLKPSAPSAAEILRQAEQSEMRTLVKNRAQLEALVQQAIDGTLTVHQELPPETLTMGPVVGRGASGTVFKGEYKGNQVAIKKYGEENPCWDLKEFRREVAIMSLLEHENLIKCVGASTKDLNHLYLVTELLPQSLTAVLKKEPLPTLIQVQLALGIARGMEYLHSLEIIHRDLKSQNVLLTQDLGVRIIDFGTCRVINRDKNMSLNIGTACYMAPELFKNSPYTENVDVYSFGILLWEIMTQKEPFSDLPNYSIPVAVTQGTRPPLPANLQPEIRNIIELCWNGDPTRRPTFTAIAQMLSDHTRVSAPVLKPSLSHQVADLLSTTTSSTGSLLFIAKGTGITAYDLTGSAESPVNEIWQIHLTRKGVLKNLLTKSVTSMFFDIESTVLYAVEAGVLYAIKSDSGTLIWQVQHPEQSSQIWSLKSHNGVLILGGNKCVLCVNKTNGSKNWATQLPTKATFTACVHLCIVSNTIYASGLGHLFLIDASTGVIKASVSLELKLSLSVCCSPHPQNPNLITTTTVGRVCCMQLIDDNLKITATKNFKSLGSITVLPHPSDGDIVLIGFTVVGAKVKAINRKSLDTVWTKEVSSTISSLVALATCPRIPGSLFVATNGHIFCLDLKTGDEKGRLSLPDCGYSNVVLLPLGTVMPLMMAGSVGHWYLINATDLTLLHKSGDSALSSLGGALVTGASLSSSMDEHTNGHLIDHVVVG